MVAMRARSLVFAILFFGALPAHAEEAEAFLGRWLDAQNKGDFAAYQALYAESFRGVRTSGSSSVAMDRTKWMEDRARMFRKPMVVEATGVVMRKVPEGTLAELEQSWTSGDYKDVGKKTLLLVAAGESFQIAREELLTSRRALLPGQIMEVRVPAKSAEAAEAARDRFAAVVGMLPGIKDWPLRVSDKPLGVIALACDRPEFAELAEVAQAIDPTAVARVVRGASSGCPELEPATGDEEHDDWPLVAEAQIGKRTLTVFVTKYTQADMGDFGRERQGHHLVALYRDENRAVLATKKAESASDFSELEDVSGDGRKVVVTETYIDDPCDGTSRNRYKKLRRETSIAPDPAAPDQLRLRTSDTTLERGKCDDSGYREWIRDMNRAR